jgi:hypothetical protein
VVGGHDHQQGVGETRAIQVPGSYMRAARVDRTVIEFVPGSIRERLQVKVHGIGRPVGRWHGRVLADDGLSPGWLTAEQGSFVGRDHLLPGGRVVGPDAALPLLVSVDGGHLGDHAFQPSSRKP